MTHTHTRNPNSHTMADIFTAVSSIAAFVDARIAGQDDIVKVQSAAVVVVYTPITAPSC